VGLYGGVNKKKLSSFLGCEDSTSALSDNLYLLLKRDKSAGPLLAPIVTTSPDVDTHAGADIQPDRVSKRDQL
jgi:hypothetical protein